MQRSQEEKRVAQAQALVRRFLVRCRIYKQICQRYEKIFDPKRKKYYYYDVIADKSSWKKPKLLLKSDIQRISPTYSFDQAALIIQCAFRRVKACQVVSQKYISSVNRILDESSGKHYFFNPTTGFTSWELPSFVKLKQITHPDDEDLSISVDNRSNISNAFGSLMSSDDSDLDEDSDVVREKKRLARKYPRSKAQSYVDFVEDNMHSVFELNLSHLNASRFTSRIYDLTELTSLDLSHNALRHISPEVQYLSNLKLLNLCDNKISRVPKEIEELRFLRDFNLSFNRISQLSGYFYKLECLENLNLSHNILHEIPVEVGNLELLKELHCWEVGIGLLKSLYTFDISFNSLNIWPVQLDQVTMLTSLNVSHNQIEEIPVHIKGNVNLTNIDFSFNKIKALPAEILDLELLQILKGNNNFISEIPKVSIFPSKELIHLTELDLSYNNISILNDSVKLFSNLQSFNIGFNSISSISASIGSLTALVALDISNNKLSEIPRELMFCKELRNLNIASNALETFPTSVSSLSKLIQLNLSKNEIREIKDDAFAKLLQLEKLMISNNQLSQIPSSLYFLKRLSTLDLSKNRISNLSENLGNLYALRELYLSGNELTSIPDEIKLLSRLVSLGLERNSLFELPQSLTQLTKLEKITLSQNDLQKIPPQLILLPRLKHWNLSWNKGIIGHFREYPASDLHHCLDRDSENFVSFHSIKVALLRSWDRLEAYSERLRFNQMQKYEPRRDAVDKFIKLHRKLLSNLSSDDSQEMNSASAVKILGDCQSELLTELRSCSVKVQSNPIIKLLGALSQLSTRGSTHAFLAKDILLAETCPFSEAIFSVLEKVDLGADIDDSLEDFVAISLEINALIDQQIYVELREHIFKFLSTHGMTSATASKQNHDANQTQQFQPRQEHGFFSIFSSTHASADTSFSNIALEDILPELPAKKDIINFQNLPHKILKQWAQPSPLPSMPFKFSEEKTVLLLVALESYFGTASCLFKKAQALLSAIRFMERTKGGIISVVDVAQREGPDFEDLIGDRIIPFESKSFDKNNSSHVDSNKKQISDIGNGAIVNNEDLQSVFLHSMAEKSMIDTSEALRVQLVHEIKSLVSEDFYLLRTAISQLRELSLLWANTIIDYCFEILSALQIDSRAESLNDRQSNLSVQQRAELKSLNLRIQFTQGLILKSLGCYTKAIHYFRNVISRTKGRNKRAYVEIGKCYLALGNFQHGQEFIKNILIQRHYYTEDLKSSELFLRARKEDPELAYLLLFAQVHLAELRKVDGVPVDNQNPQSPGVPSDNIESLYGDAFELNLGRSVKIQQQIINQEREFSKRIQQEKVDKVRSELMDQVTTLLYLSQLKLENSKIEIKGTVT